ncbi:hypothetical protein ACJJTC_006240 [Scirpophaga incertulas]
MNGSDPKFNESVTEAQASDLYKVFWLSGLAVSCFCFLVQIIFFVLLKACRNVDEKILAQMTFARIMVTITEFCVTYNIVTSDIGKDLIYTAYFYVDFSLVVWMLVFSKNLYDKIHPETYFILWNMYEYSMAAIKPCQTLCERRGGDDCMGHQ